MKSNIKCEHPVIIANPNLPFLVRNGYSRIVTKEKGFFNVTSEDIITKEVISNVTGEVYMKEFLNIVVLHQFSGLRLLPEFEDDDLFQMLPRFITKSECGKPTYKNLLSIHKKRYYPVYDIPVNDLDKYYIFSDDKQHIEPLFYAVPCGRCSICRNHSSNVIEARCRLEFAKCSSVPYLVTLTFDDEHYPDNFSRETQTIILQKFFKRLRRYLDYRGLKTDFKYFAVSEYGSLHHRFHYHIIFFGVDKELNLVHYSKIFKRYCSDFAEIVYNVWHKGIIDCRAIDLNKGTSPIRYVCKYLRKQFASPNKTYNWKSIYLGRDKILEYKDNILSSFKDETFEILSNNGKTMTIPMYSFVKRIVSPQLSRSLSFNVRQRLYVACNLFNYLYKPERRHLINDRLLFTLKRYHSRYLPLYERLHYISSDMYHSSILDFDNKDVSDNVDDLIFMYEQLNSLNLDVNKLSTDHDFYVENVVLSSDEFDIDIMKYIIDNKNNSLIARELDNQ